MFGDPGWGLGLRGVGVGEMAEGPRASGFGPLPSLGPARVSTYGLQGPTQP